MPQTNKIREQVVMQVVEIRSKSQSLGSHSHRPRKKVTVLGTSIIF